MVSECDGSTGQVRMSTEPKTVIGSRESEGNSVTLYGVDHLKTGEVNSDGRFYLSRDVSRAYVEFALMREGTVAALGSSMDGEVVLNDVELLARKRVLSNGVLHVGEQFGDDEVTVAIRVLEEDVEPQNQQKEVS